MVVWFYNIKVIIHAIPFSIVNLVGGHNDVSLSVLLGMIITREQIGIFDHVTAGGEDLSLRRAVVFFSLMAVVPPIVIVTHFLV